VKTTIYKILKNTYFLANAGKKHTDLRETKRELLPWREKFSVTTQKMKENKGDQSPYLKRPK
jgi:hypothetical protein